MTSGRQPGSAHHAGTTLTYDGGWGDYRPAIDRHARTVGRDAPAPSIDGRLNPAFVEWMMMLPAGWVTGIDISRTAQLRCLGNSLVWLQAATAWAALLGVDTRERERKMVRMLPTPRASDSNGPGTHGNGGPDLRTVQ